MLKKYYKTSNKKCKLTKLTFSLPWCIISNTSQQRQPKGGAFYL